MAAAHVPAERILGGAVLGALKRKAGGPGACMHGVPERKEGCCGCSCRAWKEAAGEASEAINN
ncbi:hypothetical protein E2562_003186 [Oryza meyeriana var. granulata]|uniref:Uncharacterized protein n=1 Tax=Oryza meyeriana var. granulata TaxID=110450 RepID=A0A6G1EUQ9_9ORYZ|nr:hypothetical protein E2562_003186 [Oryza meyeriana var. granulata]